MRRDPEELYELSADVPDLDGVPMLHHLEGFMDAGAAGRLLAEHLAATCEPVDAEDDHRPEPGAGVLDGVPP